MIKRGIGLSLSWLYLSNDTIEWKGLQALHSKPKPKETESENCSAKRGVKASQTRKSERLKKSSLGWRTETIQKGGEQQEAQVSSRLYCPPLKTLNTALSTGNISVMHKGALSNREQSRPGWLSTTSSNQAAQHRVLQKEGLSPGSSAAPAGLVALSKGVFFACKLVLLARDSKGCCCSGFGNQYISRGSH